jgi:hypothetical protein
MDKEINILKDGRIVMKVNLPEITLPSSLSMCQTAPFSAQRNPINSTQFLDFEWEEIISLK